jgi:putative DNA-invertase from lambdoid prophage Rac
MTAARAAIYLRVSTDEQTVENQLPDLQRLAAARGHPNPFVLSETGSAARERPVLTQLMEAARTGQIRTVFVWALDRLDRSMVACMQRVLELDRLGVTVVSLKEPWLDTSGPVRSLLVAIFAWVAEQERARLIDRTKAGMARAKANGARIGRPRVESSAMRNAMAAVKGGAAVHAAAKRWKVGVQTLRDHLSRENPGG